MQLTAHVFDALATTVGIVGALVGLALASATFLSSSRPSLPDGSTGSSRGRPHGRGTAGGGLGR